MAENDGIKEFIIGREGCQPFRITNASVSGKHAKISVTKSDDKWTDWTIEDLNSDNGTFILNKRGKWVEVKSRISISEDTIVRLGQEYGYGIRFTAHRLIANEKDDYRYEFYEMLKLNKKLDKERRGLKHRELLRIGLLIVSVGIAFVPDDMFPSKYLNSLVNRLTIIVPALVAAWVAWQGQRDREALEQRQELNAVCPNPECNHQLDKNSQKRLECPKCKARYAYIPQNANFNTKTP